jgi:hypothetical protein
MMIFEIGLHLLFFTPDKTSSHFMAKPTNYYILG